MIKRGTKNMSQLKTWFWLGRKEEEGKKKNSAK